MLDLVRYDLTATAAVAAAFSPLAAGGGRSLERSAATATAAWRVSPVGGPPGTHATTPPPPPPPPPPLVVSEVMAHPLDDISDWLELQVVVGGGCGGDG